MIEGFGQAVEREVEKPPLVVVYVRLGDDKTQRRLSFDRPSSLSARTLLVNGYAIDGNQCVVDVSADELLKAEMTIAEFLAGSGHDVDFR